MDPPSEPIEAVGDSAEDLKATLVNTSTPIDGTVTEQEIKESVILSAEKGAAWLAIQLQEYKEIIKHRKNWSDGLLSLVCFIVFMDFLVVIFAGTGKLSFDSPWAIPAFVASNLAEVFGLSFIVVQFLFPRPRIDDQKNK